MYPVYSVCQRSISNLKKRLYSDQYETGTDSIAQNAPERLRVTIARVVNHARSELFSFASGWTEEMPQFTLPQFTLTGSKVTTSFQFNQFLQFIQVEGDSRSIL